MDISHLREEYTQAGLSRDNLKTSPFDQFELWFKQAQHAQLAEPNAMSLATVSASGMPSLRTVLLKYFDQSGFVFFTNYSSNKARDITSNPHVAIMFPWVALERQVVIQGKAEKISTAESLRYFTSRPHGSQLGAWVSHQSSVITGRKVLELKLEEMKRKFREGKVPLPDFWGGYRVVPENIEFWQGRPSRLHDRFQYTRLSAEKGCDWQVDRLSP
ncbi:pyridoxamine 5'-phosphate oxidase [Endozoicomonas sp. GU-1]|uniref:pyridoxamine 5'-phosphate oxidase n=1 Tax=Endozoicomonas sp. GU-1 TaxID=3009078 RepID=UPI0022B47A65|nr:pyridoxamine 5'-phosphate oxidase [Endozoicomonas sp. GU-1]WBA79602.1 pyridoxamine 5'-phosphate oxidase [Endozoicomonas sp. GU-1]WBA87185.1 pyridoxamine 5'-phosphate oxidase [Endozoicomonas sp. GU-1]